MKILGCRLQWPRPAGAQLLASNGHRRACNLRCTVRRQWHGVRAAARQVGGPPAMRLRLGRSRTRVISSSWSSSRPADRVHPARPVRHPSPDGHRLDVAGHAGVRLGMRVPRRRRVPSDQRPSGAPNPRGGIDQRIMPARRLGLLPLRRGSMVSERTTPPISVVNAEIVKFQVTRCTHWEQSFNCRAGSYAVCHE